MHAERGKVTLFKSKLGDFFEKSSEWHLGMRFYRCVRLDVSALVYLCADGIETSSDRTYGCYKISDRRMGGATVERGNTVGAGPKYLIRDRDSKYATHFSAVGASIKEVETPYRTPQANGVCERFMGSIRRECLMIS
jgi:hypothetical protein